MNITKLYGLLGFMMMLASSTNPLSEVHNPLVTDTLLSTSSNSYSELTEYNLLECSNYPLSASKTIGEDKYQRNHLQPINSINPASVSMGRYKSLNMKMTKKEKVVALLNSFNTGDKTPISYINPEKYIQHNLSVGDGLAGFGEVMQHAPPEGFKAKVVRAFEDGDYVFTHTEYEFFGPKIGIDVFRFENDLIVEHWDNLIEVQPPNPSGRTQTDGEDDITDKDKTAANKKVISSFINDVLLNHENDKITTYINPTKYIQHNPAVADGLEGFGAAMKYFAENGLVMEYTKLHKVLGEGNFVLAISEGKFGKGELTAFYDLFRLENGQIVEHWDVISPIPPQSEWKNENGKF